MTDEELRYRMERVTERMAGADDTNEVVVSVALMRELFGRLEQMQAKIDAVPVRAIAEAYEGIYYDPGLRDWLDAQVQP